METLEIRTLQEWVVKLRQRSTYNLKWRPEISQIKAVLHHCQFMLPDYFIEVGTGNGITASFIAAAGIKVITFDPADRPKVYLDEKFPLTPVKNMIDFRNSEINLTTRPSSLPCFWFIDVGGEKTIKQVRRFIEPLTVSGDVIYCDKEFITK